MICSSRLLYWEKRLTRSAYFLLFSVLFCTVPPLAAQAPAKPLTVEAIFAHGPLIGTLPSGVSWSPDGKHLTYLDGEELMEIDPANGKARVLVSRAKMAELAGTGASEKDSDHRERYKMASYLWSPDSKHLLFDAGGRLWYYDLHSGTGVQVGFSATASGDDPKFSPNGKSLAFVRDHGLSVVSLRSSASSESSLSTVAAAPNPETLNGEVDWVYLEELETRSNYFWSPDSNRLAFLQTNESAVTQYPLTDWIPTHAQVDSQRYPQPGDPNPEVRVGVVGAGGGKTVWVKLPIRAGQDYIPRFGWADPKTLWIETLTRDHKHRTLFFADASTGEAHPALELSDDKFLAEDYDLSVEAGFIVLTDWRDGHSHLYLYSYDPADAAHATAKLERQLTKGDFEVSAVYRVDSAARTISYASNEGNPQEQQIWQIDFNGNRRQLSTGAGTHEANFAPQGGAFAEKVSTRLDPPMMRLCPASGPCSAFWQTHAVEPYHLRAPEPIEVKAHDGTLLYATLLLPEGATSSASVPLILNPYGGPGAQTVGNLWKDSLLFDELLTRRGFAVLHADNRGMGHRGRAFAQAAYRDFGAVQFEDQLTVLDAVLARYPQLDSKRLGWWGWSWGGSFTLYAMTHSDRFRAGVSVAPVTDFRNYDSIYTERYLGLPADSADAYKNASLVDSAAHLKGRLLLVHGTGDDNVHLENSIQFIQKLIEAGIPYDLQLYPRKTHAIAGSEARVHLYGRILQHFEQYLKPESSSN
jgi:dipeptidyl-peptidase-4